MADSPAAALRQVIRKVAKADHRYLTDRELLRRFVSDDDQQAFAVLVSRHSGMVMGVCRRTLPTVQDAEDACQATFLVLARKAKGTRWQPSIANWLYATARKVAQNAQVAARRRAQREARAGVSAAVEPVERMSARELLAALDQELDKLPPRYREPIVLCFLEGLTRDDAATRLGIPIATLHTRIDRGRKRLHEALTKSGVALGAGLLALVATSPAGASPPRLAETVLAAASGRPPATVAALAQGIAVNGLTTKLVFGMFALIWAVALGIGAGAISLTAAAPKADAGPSTKPAAPEKTEGNKAPPPVKEKEAISGSVLGPDGKPVAGAKVYALNWLRSSEKDKPIEIATSSEDGTFLGQPPPQKDGLAPTLVAIKDGFGPGWVQVDSSAKSKTAVVLKLAADHPITGRIVNTEGKPVANARVVAERVSGPAEGNLDAVLQALKVDPSRGPTVPNRVLYPGWKGGVAFATSDADGRFKLTGCGVERFVHLSVSGDDLANQSVFVVNRPGFDPKPYDDAAARWQQESPSRPKRTLHGPELSIVVERAKSVEGIVIDADTKKPLAGVSVTDLRNPIRTDESGRFKLGGLRKAKQYTLYAGGPVGGDYLPRTFKVEDTEGYAPVRCELALRRGVVVTGRITDKATGKPLSAGVMILPVGGNKHFAEFYPPGHIAERAAHLTDAEGRYRVVTIPGQLLVVVQAHDQVHVGDARLSPYRGAGPDPAHPEVFDTKRQRGYAFLDLADMSLHAISRLDHGVRIVDAPVKGAPVVADFALDHGVTGRIRFEGPDGKPVAGATVIGLAHANIPAKLPDATVTVYALDPKSTPRQVIAISTEKKLGGMTTIRGDERKEVVVQLAPLADIIGKCVTADGKPLAGATVLFDGPEEVDGLSALLHTQFGVGSRSTIHTRADGTFRIAGVLPGLNYQLRIMKGRTSCSTGLDDKPTTVRPEPGKLADIGVLQLREVKDGM